MSRHTRLHRSSRQLLLAAVAFSLVMGLLSAGPAAAHNFTRTDGNDSPGKLDIRTASVGHANNKVVHTVRTFEGWTPRSLGNDSFFIVEIDKNFDNDFEQCAFIFFAGGRLRGSLTNCRRTFIRQLPVSKPSKAVARITIPTANTGQAYRWVVFSFWTGLPARCSDLCFDAAPNRPPPILHDMEPPTVSLEQTTLRVWESSESTTFNLPFSVSDHRSGVKSWRLQRRPLGGTTWTTLLSGSGGASRNPEFVGEPGQWTYRVVAVDKQGNTLTKSRSVYVPTDVTDPGGPGTFIGGQTLDPALGAFGGGYVALADAGDSYQLQYTHPGGPCRRFELIGPGLGEWTVNVSGPSGSQQLFGINFTEAHRQELWSESTCADATWTFTVDAASTEGFGVDAVLIDPD